MFTNKLVGMGVALITPFKNDFSIDFEALEKLVEFQIQNGTDYLVVLGTTGETPTLKEEEKKQIIDTVVRVNNSRIPIVLGVGGNDTMGGARHHQAQHTPTAEHTRRYLPRHLRRQDRQGEEHSPPHRSRATALHHAQHTVASLW